MLSTFLGAVLLYYPVQANAQQTLSWQGQRVLISPSRESLELGTVQSVNGELLLVKSEQDGTERWMKTQDLILFNKALEHFADLIRSNPKNSDAYFYRGLVWGEKGEQEIAILDINDAIRLSPGGNLYWTGRAGIWLAHKDYDRAIADCNEAIRLGPNYANTYTNRGRAWTAKKEYDKAIADFDEAIRLAPTSANAYFQRASVWIEKQDYDKAIADCNEVIRLRPNIAVVYYRRAGVWNTKKDYAKAVADYNEVLRINPTNTGAYNSLAWIEATCPDAKYRDGQKAVADASQACQLGNYKYADAIDTLAAAYAERGDFEKAIELQEKANKLYSDAETRKKGEERLNLYRGKKPYRTEYDGR